MHLRVRDGQFLSMVGLDPTTQTPSLIMPALDAGTFSLGAAKKMTGSSPVTMN